MFKYFVTLTNLICIHEEITARLISECLLAFGPQRSILLSSLVLSENAKIKVYRTTIFLLLDMGVKHSLTLREAEGVRECGAKEDTWALEGEGNRGMQECANKYLLLQFKLTSDKKCSKFFDHYESKSTCTQIILHLLYIPNPQNSRPPNKICNFCHLLKYSLRLQAFRIRLTVSGFRRLRKRNTPSRHAQIKG